LSSAEDFEARLYSVGEVADAIGVSRQTLRVWESKGLVVPGRSPGGQRQYSEADLERAAQVARLRRRHGWTPSAVGNRASLDRSAAERLRVGAVVRRARREAKQTIAALAQQVGISRSFLSAVERGESGLSVQLQSRLAEALSLSLTDFAPAANAGLKVVRPADRLVTELAGGITWEELAAPGHAFEPALLIVPPGQTSGGAVARPAENFVFVLDGSIRFTLHDNEQDIVLEPEDALILPPETTWSWMNVGTAPARLVWVEQRPGARTSD
jgi:DNA-binding transcriptional MerR regulator/quercetin dioxygenase-like cupin family protein